MLRIVLMLCHPLLVRRYRLGCKYAIAGIVSEVLHLHLELATGVMAWLAEFWHQHNEFLLWLLPMRRKSLKAGGGL